MSRKFNLLNNILSLVLTVALLFLVVYICNQRYTGEAGKMITFILLGAVASGFIITFLHELGHLVFGKANGFAFLSFCVWFFRWSRINGEIIFDFVWLGEEAGSTQMVSKNSDNLAKRYGRMTVGGLIFTFIAMIIGIIPLFLYGLPLWLFVFWAMFLPIGAYVFFGNALPMENGGVDNDGGVILGLKKNCDSSKVAVNLLAIQSELYNGKTPAEIDENLYFDLPQLPEDDLNFILLLSARYYYYLDKEDYENAKKVSDRAVSLLDYMPKSVVYAIKADALYNSCTFDFNEEVADDLAYELERYLNSINNATNLRVKLSYVKNIKKDQEIVENFYKKGVKEAKKCPIKGLSMLEIKLLDKLVSEQ